MGRDNQRFHEYVRSRSHQPPRILYKYTTAETALAILSSGRLRFQTPLHFNDPFDAQWNVLWQLWTPEFNEALADLIRDAALGTASHPDGHALRPELSDLQTWYAQLEPEVRRDAIAAYVLGLRNGLQGEPPGESPRELIDLLRRTRMCCFSETEDSLLLWSHYADQHRGVVLTFDVAGLEQSFKIPVESITYTEHLPPTVDTQAHANSYVFDFDVQDDHNALVRALTLVKAECWRYEKEWRFVYKVDKGDSSTFSDVPFPPTALRGITAGCKFDRERYSTLDVLARKYPQADLRSAARHPSGFALDISPRKQYGAS